MALWLSDTFTSYAELSSAFADADDKHAERMRQTDALFQRTANDPTVGFQPARRAPFAPDAPVPRTLQSGSEAFAAESPYQRPLRPTPDDDVESRERSDEEEWLARIEQALLEASAELGMPSRMSGAGRRGRFGRWFDAALDWLGWSGGASITRQHQQSFEAALGPMLLGFQMSPYWLYQKLQYQRKRRKIDWHYSPVSGRYQSSFSETGAYDDGKAPPTHRGLVDV